MNGEEAYQRAQELYNPVAEEPPLVPEAFPRVINLEIEPQPSFTSWFSPHEAEAETRATQSIHIDDLAAAVTPLGGWHDAAREAIGTFRIPEMTEPLETGIFATGQREFLRGHPGENSIDRVARRALSAPPAATSDSGSAPADDSAEIPTGTHPTINFSSTASDVIITGGTGISWAVYDNYTPFESTIKPKSKPKPIENPKTVTRRVLNLAEEGWVVQ